MYSSRRGANYLTEICVQVRQIRLHVIRTIYKKTGDALYMKDFRRYPVLEALRILAYTAYRSSSPQGGGLFRAIAPSHVANAFEVHEGRGTRTVALMARKGRFPPCVLCTKGTSRIDFARWR